MTFDNTPIPDISTADEPIRCADDLRQRWRALLGPLGFSESLLWFVVVDDEDRLTPALNQLELPIRPDAFLTDMLMTRLREVIDTVPGLSIACLISRPGRDGVTDADQSWARLLTADAQRHGVPLHPVHRANDVSLVTLTIATDAVA
ncbi:hypothetical protein [Gordonia rhizosphera]|uniref:Uncharacterized protein n=1 Tax=Gordonia rhizosphera NBRC 16068 TaxID=1108045 RepID=K6VUE5_9ACTN|nr:hypothetical protein [Gordonia rhizosphera]GAB90525.1 hypothetical protein GORHZ_104_00550 [Gordonia rhizosphera NBRC 16068]